MTKETIVNEAIRIFGSSRTAYGWLAVVRPELDGKRAIDLLDTPSGREHVMTILSRIALD